MPSTSSRQPDPAAILSRYPIGAIHEIEPIKKGLMHSTWQVDCEAGRRILQRLHPKLSTPEILGDYEAVTEHLAARGCVAPRLVRTSDEQPVAIDGEDRWWRLATYVPGETRARVTRGAEAEQGARALGRFHKAMNDIEHRFGSQHPLHDTEGHLARLVAAREKPEHADALATVAGEVDEVIARLREAMLPTGLPQRVVHGDPKISNVLFQDGKAVGLIDLDTCMRHTVLVDLGDAVRSWCRDGAEDEKERFRLERFDALLEGYAAEGPALTEAERALLPDAGRIITLELASRFLRDVLEDEYFAWDDSRYVDRRSHNRARGRAMLHMAADMADKRAETVALVRRWLGD